ncbi:hypothetical protein [uncultured Hoeflea sp.]|uniref:hypothetical protein n=1 Tax=uncultured Hoeflea sp. TaxID=538666 RepID=UPI0026055CFD|nr:hypothetical protein [uncultured Hoeflea sp.]
MSPVLPSCLWLKRVTEAEVLAHISNPEHGVRLARGERLGEPMIEQLAVDFHTLRSAQWGRRGR